MSNREANARLQRTFYQSDRRVTRRAVSREGLKSQSTLYHLGGSNKQMSSSAKMEQAFVRKLSCVLGITSQPTCCSRVYSAFIFCVVSSSCMHVLYTTGLEPLLNPNSDASLSIAYMFDFIARIARVVSYIIMHILTYKHANRCARA